MKRSYQWSFYTGGSHRGALSAAAVILLLAGCGSGGEDGGNGGSTAANCGTVCTVNNVYVIGPGGGFRSYPICSNTCPPVPANQAPTANLAGPSTLVVGTATVLDSTANDADGDPLEYHWALLSKPTASSAAIADETISDLPFTPDVAGRYLFSLVVDDGELLADTLYHIVDVEDNALAGFDLTLVDAQGFATEAVGVAIGNLDGAGGADVVIGRCSGWLEALLNDGAANFSRHLPVSGLLGCSGALTVGEFTGDGFADVVTYGSILPGDGAGEFGTPTALPVLAANLLGGDFNGDGNDDVAVVKSRSAFGADDAAVKILLGAGGGGLSEDFSAYTPTEVVPVGVGDFDGDSIDDLAYYSALFDAAGNSELTILLGDAGGNYDTGTTIPVPGRGTLGIGDINGDGDADIVMSFSRGNQPELPSSMPPFVGIGFATILGNGDGTFGALRSFDAANFSYSNIAIYDFDDDGDVDFVYRGDTGAVNVLLGDGAGGVTDVVLLPAGVDFGGFAVGEIDGDTLPDILLADEFGPGGNSGILRIAFGVDNQVP